METNPKRYLKRYQDIKSNIRMYAAEIDELESLATSCTAPTDGEPSAGGATQDKMATIVAKIVDTQTEIVALKYDAVEELKTIHNVIGQVEQQKYREILSKRYIEGKRWEAIAVEMHYSYRQTTRLHGEALLAVSVIINTCP